MHSIRPTRRWMDYRIASIFADILSCAPVCAHVRCFCALVSVNGLVYCGTSSGGLVTGIRRDDEQPRYVDVQAFFLQI